MYRREPTSPLRDRSTPPGRLPLFSRRVNRGSERDADLEDLEPEPDEDADPAESG